MASFNSPQIIVAAIMMILIAVTGKSSNAEMSNARIITYEVIFAFGFYVLFSWLVSIIVDILAPSPANGRIKDWALIIRKSWAPDSVRYFNVKHIKPLVFYTSFTIAFVFLFMVAFSWYVVAHKYLMS